MSRKSRLLFKREENPTVRQTAALVVAAIAGTALVVTALVKRKSKKDKAKKKKQKKYSCAPYSYDQEEVLRAIKLRIREGFQDRSLVASEVASGLFGEYPGGGTVEFPPGPDDPTEAQCVWALVVDLVESTFAREGIDLAEPEEPVWEIRGRDDPGYPWVQPSLEINNVPTPSMFLDMGNFDGHWNPIDGYDSMVRTTLASALAMAGQDPALATGSSSTSKRLRRETRALFHCSEWMDKLYGQTDLERAHGRSEAGQTWMLNAKSRGLNWRNVHADNLVNIAQSKPLERTTDLEGRLLPGSGGNTSMLVWVPAIDLAGLRLQIPTVRAMTWADGSSTTEPPPVVQRLRVNMSGVELPGGPGC